MANFFQQIKAQMREKETAQAILSMPLTDRPILVYAEDDYSWNQLGPYVRSVVRDHHMPVVYVTSDPDDPRIDDHDDLMTVHTVKDSIVSFLPRVDSPVFVTTMPDLDSFHIKRPRNANVTYAFHSLNSIHMAYRPGAFDAYDSFLCPGPHIRDELDKHFAKIGKTDYQLFDVGYPKLDGIIGRYDRYTKVHPDRQTVLLAPSWGKANILATQGVELIDALATTGYRVVVRPHPAFFESIYPEGAGIVDEIAHTFGQTDNVVLETSITSEDSFMEADLLISDWSGASFEYALGTQRPVLFVDVPPKVNNPGWEALGIVPFEDQMRHQVGTVVEPGDIPAAAAAVENLLSRADEYRERLAAIRDTAVYNVGRSAAAGAEVLVELAKDRLGRTQI